MVKLFSPRRQAASGRFVGREGGQMPDHRLPVDRLGILQHVSRNVEVPADVERNRLTGGKFDERVGGAGQRDHRDQMRRLFHGGEPLGLAVIRPANCAHATSRPGLGRAPG